MLYCLLEQRISLWRKQVVEICIDDNHVEDEETLLNRQSFLHNE
jgi:hypothetical protein